MTHELRDHWTTERVSETSAGLEHAAPREILEWGLDHFAPGIALATGFGPSGVALCHMVSVLDPKTTVFYLDTGLLFTETYELRDELSSRLGLEFTRVASSWSVDEQNENVGPELWNDNPDACCFLRKVLPLRQFLSKHAAWISGIRRDQSGERAEAQVVEWDAGDGLVKINPMAGWSSADVWNYVEQHDLPTNPLHGSGYPSLGCWPCTRPVGPGDAERSGRWAGRAKTECGIHIPHRAA